MLAVDNEYCMNRMEEIKVSCNSEIAIIPPISGGWQKPIVISGFSSFNIWTLSWVWNLYIDHNLINFEKKITDKSMIKEE